MNEDQPAPIEGDEQDPSEIENQPKPAEDDEDQPAPPADDTEESDEQEDEDEDEPAPTPRENKRIRQLNDKFAQLAQQQQTPEQKKKESLIDEGDYTQEEINELASKYGEERYQEGVAQAKALEFKVNLKIDVPKVNQKYEYLDKDSDTFDPGRAAFVNNLFLKTVGYNQQNGSVTNSEIGYEEFVDGLMELVDNAATAKSADTVTNLAKQSAQRGVRPGGVAKKDYQGDDPSKMSDAQLQAAIKQGLGIK